MNTIKPMRFSLFNLLAQVVSILFHPLFMYAYMLVIVKLFSPYLFHQVSPLEEAKLIVLNIVYTTLFPIIAIVIMKALGLIKSLQMEDSKERIGPLIATAIFYSWTFINIRNSQLMPDIATLALLGVILGLYLGFFFNNFTKVSLHGLGTGGLLAFAIYYEYKQPLSFIGPFGENLSTILFSSTIFLVALIVFALVSWSRLYLDKHSLRQVLQGNLLGIIGMLLAFLYLN